jgi:hypothetical protein
MLLTSQKGDNMTTELSATEPEERKMQVRYRGGSSDTVYGLGLIGAWVYYISRATTFRQGVLGFFKGIVWPAFLVYELLEFLDKE